MNSTQQIITSVTTILLVLFILSMMISIAFGDSYEKMYFSEQNPNVNVWIVDNSYDIPCTPKYGHIIYGCSFYFENRYKEDSMYILNVNHIDKYGLTPFEHEKLHIECNCDFHKGKLADVMMKQSNVYDVVMNNIWAIKMILIYY
jgi:hypothetical protein